MSPAPEARVSAKPARAARGAAGRGGGLREGDHKSREASRWDGRGLAGPGVRSGLEWRAGPPGCQLWPRCPGGVVAPRAERRRGGAVAPQRVHAERVEAGSADR